MSKQRQLERLIERYRAGKCSEEEISQLRKLLQEEESQDILGEVYDKLPDSSLPEGLLARKSTIYKRVVADDRLQSDTAQVRAGKGLWTRVKPWAAVAAVALIVMIPLLYYGTSFLKIPNKTDHAVAYTIMPGGDRARIILDDGREINLEEIMGDTIIVQNGFSIVKEGTGTIYYKYDSHQSLAQTTVYNTVITPKGGQYQVTLPDGTRVWLNAESKLRYPVYFDDGQREVELEGEGYFEVAEQTIGGKRVSFIVTSGAQKLEVLGTAFNIQAYGSDIKTTLVEGKVRLGLQNESGNVTLEANDQAFFQHATKEFGIRKVDPIYATAWKDGKFSFHRASIQEVMDAVGRWYDVDIEYEKNIQESYFTGSISRFEQIDMLLKTIELTQSVHFAIKGRRVIVKE